MDSNIEEEIKTLSKKKWQWMADKKVNTLAVLFHDNAKFVHMGGPAGKLGRSLHGQAGIEPRTVW